MIASRTAATPQMFVIAGTLFGCAICAARRWRPPSACSSGCCSSSARDRSRSWPTCNTLIQLRVRSEMRGRVMSVYTITLLGSTPIGGPLVGLVCEVWGPRVGVCAVGGVGTLVAMAVFGTAFVRGAAAATATATS